MESSGTGHLERIPVAFLSYARESDQHSAWVRDFGGRLRALGIDARLDQWHLSPGDDLVRFMTDGVQKSDFVLVVCTPKYAAKANANDGGVGFEGSVIAGSILTQGAAQRKFIPLLRAGTAAESIPAFLLNRLYIDFTRDAELKSSVEALVRHMQGRPDNVPPPIARIAPTPTGY